MGVVGGVAVAALALSEGESWSVAALGACDGATPRVRDLGVGDRRGRRRGGDRADRPRRGRLARCCGSRPRWRRRREPRGGGVHAWPGRDAVAPERGLLTALALENVACLDIGAHGVHPALCKALLQAAERRDRLPRE